jgi:hypothetical protein
MRMFAAACSVMDAATAPTRRGDFIRHLLLREQDRERDREHRTTAAVAGKPRAAN